jgi:hypothetical protein
MCWSVRVSLLLLGMFDELMMVSDGLVVRACIRGVGRCMNHTSLAV